MKRRSRSRARLIASVVVVTLGAVTLGVPAPLLAQQTEWDAGQLFATRAQLEEMLRKFESASRAAGYSEATRSIADDEAELIRYRLVEGDFEVGDEIQLTVVGQTALTNKFVVAPGRILILPDIEEFPLRGLLRSELKEALTRHLARFYRDPQVYVQTSIRVQAVGEIGQPGFKMVSADQRFPDVLASLGQPTRSANLDKIRVMRGKETIWDGAPLQEAIIEGRTVDQLNLRAGDIIEVPAVARRDIRAILQSLYFLVPLSLAITRIF
jgi:hypothetical protein